MRLEYTGEQLMDVAQSLRKDVIAALYAAGSGHPGGSLSIAEIMSVLYFRVMDVDPQNPDWEDRDRFVLSKGHAAPCYYAALSKRGFFNHELLKTLRKADSFLQGHPDRKHTPGVDMSTGSLGQGISAACGMALYGKKKNRPFHVYCVVGDGEMQEGQVWEALMSAAHFKLDNLTVILDNNNLQIDGPVDRIMNIYPIKEKVEAFGWTVLESDGHNVDLLTERLSKENTIPGKPTFLICHTVKGKGISYMENQVAWHGAPISEHQYLQAMDELQVRKGC